MPPLMQPFDVRSVQPYQAIEPVPVGEYDVVIVSSEMKATADGSGGKLELTLQIIKGQYQGKTFKFNLNLYNTKSQQTVEIAYRQLSAIGHAVGAFHLQNTEELHNKPFIVRLVINAGGYNDVKAIKDVNGNIPGQPGSTNGPVMASGAPAVAAPVWGAPAAAAPAPAAQPPAQWPQPPAAAAPAPAPTAGPAWGAPTAGWQPPAAAAPAPAAPAGPGWTPGAAPLAPPWAAVSR